MATQYLGANAVPTSASRVSGAGSWSTTQTEGITLTYSAEGLRIRKAKHPGYGYIEMVRSPQFAVEMPQTGFRPCLSGIKFRRNTAASAPGLRWAFYGNNWLYDPIGNTWDGDFATQANVGEWVRIERLERSGDLTGNYTGSRPWPMLQLGLDPELEYDVTISDLHLYDIGNEGEAAMPDGAVLDSNDGNFIITQANDSLSLTLRHDGLNNEAVRDETIYFGDASVPTYHSLSWDKQTGQFPTVSKTFSKAGVYTISTRVSNSTSSYSKDTVVTVPVGPFEAKFTSVMSYPSVLVNASTSVAPTRSPVQQYLWNWGDGQTSTGVQAEHVYANAGTYNITLTIKNTDVQRTATVTRAVVVKAPDRAAAASNFSIGLAFDDPRGQVDPAATGLQAEVTEVPGFDSFKWNWTRNEPSTATFKAPADWLKTTLGVTKLEDVKSDIVLRVNYGTGWVEPPNGRMVIDSVKDDPLNPQRGVDVTCKLAGSFDLDGLLFTPGIIGRAYTRSEVAAGYSRLFTSTNVGKILRSMLPVATAPGSGGALLKYTSLDFGELTDSKGATWTTTISNLEVPPGANGTSLLSTLVGNGACDWYFQSNVLKAFNAYASGKRGATAAIPELQPGRDITEAPQTRSPRSITYGAVVVSGKLPPVTATDSDSTSPSYRKSHYRGQRYVVMQSDDADTTSAALAIAKPTIAGLNKAVDGEMTRELRFYDDMPWMPFRDYQVGDFVYAPGPDGKPALVAVEGLTIQQDSTGGLTASVTLGSAFAVNALAKKVASLSGGQGVSIGAVGERPPSALSGYIKTLVTRLVTNDNGEFDAGTLCEMRGIGTDGKIASLALSSDGEPRVWSLAVYDRVYTNAPNMYVTSSGTLGRTTHANSAIKYKIAIEDASFGEAVLQLEPKTWYPREIAERWAAKLDEAEGDSARAADLSADLPPLRRSPGLLAEEVEAAGLSEFVDYDEHGEIDGLQYDRLWVPLIPIIREQGQRIDRLERALEKALAQLDPDSNGDLSD